MSAETTNDAIARRRWLLLVLARTLPIAGAAFGLMLAGQATTTAVRVLGVAIVLAALVVLATLPRSLAKAWRSR